MSDKLPEILYHYTDCAGFKGIIENGCLWASNIFYLNDSNEYELALKIAEDIIERLLHKDKPYFMAPIEFVDAFLEALHSSKEYANNIFVASFSECGDELSQWRGYCPKGGYSLGFNVESLNSVITESNFQLVPCVYEKSKQIEMVEKLINYYYSEWRDDEQDNLHIVSFAFSQEILKIAPLIKDYSFKEEKEWRLIPKDSSIDRIGLINSITGVPLKEGQANPEFETGDWCSGLIRKFKNVKFRLKNSILIPYLEVPIFKKTDSSLKLQSLIVGPMNNQALAKTSADRFLESQGIKLDHGESEFSQIPYRAGL